MYSQPFLKEWYSLQEITQFLRNQRQIVPPFKTLLKKLIASNLVEFYINLEGDGYEEGSVRIGTQENSFLAVKLVDPYPFAGYAGSLQQLQDFFHQQEETTIIIDGRYTSIELEALEEKGALFPAFFCGIFAIPIETFNDVNLSFSDEKSLYLPERAFYPSFELLDNPAQANSTYNFSFLMMEFSHARNQGLFKIEDIRIYLAADRMAAFIDYFKSEPQKAEKPEETVKNKSDEKRENPKNKKEMITRLVIESIQATAEAYPDLGGYQVINAVIEAMIEKQGYRKTDFLKPESYLKKVKNHPYSLTFPQNRGRYKKDQKPRINAVLTSYLN